MNNCNMCPRQCNAVRDDENNYGGFCQMPWSFKVARAGAHLWEEPCISGTNGSGTVFFTGCTLKCVYCQNYSISTENFGKTVSEDELIKTFQNLIDLGVHNINLVNPTHYAFQLAGVLKKFHSPVPIVYNSSGYESVETLKKLEGLIDVYLPDLKYIRNDKSLKYSGVSDYFDVASKAILEMVRQVGDNSFDENGIIQKGVIVRHLILPQNTNSSIEILNWLSENLPKGNQVSLMSQYIPMGNAKEHSEINRKITQREYDKVSTKMLDLNLQNGYLQQLESASENFIPSFDLTGI